MARGRKPTAIKPQEGPGPTEALLANTTEWTFGDKVFFQRPLTIRRLGKLVTAISEEIRALSDVPGFAALLELDLDKATAAQAAPAIMGVLGSAPDSLARILAEMLDAPADADLLADHATPHDAMEIIAVFFEQNQAQTLVQSFFVLRGRVQAMVPEKDDETTPD